MTLPNYSGKTEEKYVKLCKGSEQAMTLKLAPQYVYKYTGCDSIVLHIMLGIVWGQGVGNLRQGICGRKRLLE
jgi:hypothetical protein